MSLHSYNLDRLRDSLSRLDKSLDLIGVRANPDYNAWQGHLNIYDAFNTSMTDIFNEISRHFSFDDPAHLFGTSQIATVDDILRRHIRPVMGVDRSDSWHLRNAMWRTANQVFGRLGITREDCMLYVFIVGSRMEVVLGSLGIHVQLIHNRNYSPLIILNALVSFVNNTTTHRVYTESEKDVVISGFLAFTKSLFTPDDMYTVIMNHEDGPVFYQRLRNALLSNGYDHIVPDLDKHMQEKYSQGGVDRDRKRKAGDV